MAKPEWGVKRACPSCGARFYDLLRDPIVCPSCGETFALEALTRPRRGKSAAIAPKPVKSPEPELEEVEEADELVETDDDDVLDLDDEEDAAPAVPAAQSEEGGDEATLPEFSSDEDEVVAADDDDDDVLDDDSDEVSLDELGEAEVADDEKDRD